ncbi:type II secretion system protein GspD [Candidatus Sumerlaeota bacterium]
MSVSKSRLRQYFLTLAVALMATASASLMAQDGAPPVAADEATTTAAADEATTTTAAKPAYGPDNPRQVRITSRILEWTHDNTLDWGFSVLYLANQGNSSEILRTADLTFPKQSQIDRGLTVFLDNMDTSDGEGGFEAVIETLEQAGEVKVLSEPNIVVACAKDRALEAKPVAVVRTSSKVPYEAVQPAGNVLAQITRFKDTAIQLTVSVDDIVADEYVKINVNNSVTSLSGFISVALNDRGEPMLVPQTDTRSITNTVLVRNRSLLITGILKTTRKYDKEQGIPLLARIPLLGYLFKNSQKRDSVQELLFMVRPEIIIN